VRRGEWKNRAKQDRLMEEQKEDGNDSNEADLDENEQQDEGQEKYFDIESGGDGYKIRVIEEGEEPKYVTEEANPVFTIETATKKDHHEYAEISTQASKDQIPEGQREEETKEGKVEGELEKQ